MPVTTDEPSHLTIGELTALVASSGDTAAVSALGGWVLVGPPASEDKEKGKGGEWSFRTVSARTVRFTVGSVESVLNESFQAYPLKKAPARPFAGTLLVGRSRSNDVCLPYLSVSKLHARIRLTDRGMFMSDAGSSNGTAVDGERLVGDEEKQIVHGAILRFGTCSVQAFEPTKFVEILRRFTDPS